MKSPSIEEVGQFNGLVDALEYIDCIRDFLLEDNSKVFFFCEIENRIYTVFLGEIK